MAAFAMDGVALAFKGFRANWCRLGQDEKLHTEMCGTQHAARADVLLRVN